MVGVAGGLNAENAIPPLWIVLEPDVLDDEFRLPLRLPLLPPRIMGFLERLAKLGVLNPVRRGKQIDHEIRFKFASRPLGRQFFELHSLYR
jgi:hypothetical protein